MAPTPHPRLLLGALLAGCTGSAPEPRADAHAHADSAFGALQARGEHAMGVDQYTSAHRFEELPDGGRVVLQRDPADSAGVATIRAHLQHIAARFAAGDFDLPMFVHDRTVPGTAVMTARREAICYAFDALPGGGAVRITTADPEALAAVHSFLAFQRQDHRVAVRR